MFVKIKKKRIKISSIGEYDYDFSVSQDKWYLRIRVSNRERLVYMDSEDDLKKHLTYLDKALKVSEA